MYIYKAKAVGSMLIVFIMTFFLSQQVMAAGNLALVSVAPDEKVITRPARYDYAPAVMVGDDGRYRLWWCAAVKAGLGDAILTLDMTASMFAKGEANGNLAHPVLSKSGSANKFDGAHTCDPSIVNVGGRYYMYYGGLSENKTPKNELLVATKLGVAVSQDGIVWERANGGNPILEPRTLLLSDMNRYGLGQPSVIHVDDFFYLLYTNSVGNDGPGMYVLRSRTPLFATGVEEWTVNGFVPVDVNSISTKNKLLNGFSADWAYVPSKDIFLVAMRGIEGVMKIISFDKQTLKRNGVVDVPMGWTEGPGLSRDKKGWLVYKEPVDGQFTFQIFRSIGARSDPRSWDMAVKSVTIKIE